MTYNNGIKKERLREAIKLFYQKDYFSAYNIVYVELRRHPKDTRLFCQLGIFASSLGLSDVAENYMNTLEGKKHLTENFFKDQITKYIRTVNDKDLHEKWRNYKRSRNKNERIRIAITAPLCEGKVLEIGCANGDLSTVIAAHGIEHYGIDIDPVAIEIARYKSRMLGLTNSRFKLSNGENLDLDDNTFDTVLLAEVLEHVDSPEKAIKEAIRVCKPKGKIIISVPNGYRIPDPEHVRIFNKDILNSLINKHINTSVKWINNIPSEWVMGWIINHKKDVSMNKEVIWKRSQNFIPPLPEKVCEYDEMVTVIVPTFNREDYINSALDSVLNQTYKNYEIIVVNDGSTDSTETVLQPYMDKIIYLKKENGGKSSAINYAMRYAKGDYIWVFDDDDIALPMKLELQIKKFKENPGLDIIHTSAIVFKQDSGYKKIVDYWEAESIKQKDILKRKLRGSFFHSPTVIAKRKCYTKVGDWDESLVRAQDYDMWVRIARFFNVGELRIPTVYYRLHDGIRGSSADRISISDVHNKTLKYHKKVLKKMYEFPIDDIFKELKDKPLNTSLKVEAYFKRAKTMAFYDLNEEAKKDLSKISEILNSNKYLPLSRSSILIIKWFEEKVNQWDDFEATFQVLSILKLINNSSE
ncbi:MAG: glycosyltransferase [Firmicutes bacterium]|nr:glycosyltransferase [Bacillota bacterium]